MEKLKQRLEQAEEKQNVKPFFFSHNFHRIYFFNFLYGNFIFLQHYFKVTIYAKITKSSATLLRIG